MRHVVANIVTYTIAALLFVGAGAFAWMRSEQLTIADERLLLARHAPSTSADFDWREAGAIGYARNCRNCHGADGEGWDQYPPVGAAGAFAALPDGRDFLIDVMLYGLTSDRWGAPMPPMGHMQDVEIAAVLNHIAARFGGREPERLFMPDDVAARRGQELTPAEVNARRPGSGGGQRSER